MRLSRRLGWVYLCFAPAYGGFGIFLLVSSRGGDQAEGAFLVVNACCATALAIGTAVISPRRARRRAESLLAGA